MTDFFELLALSTSEDIDIKVKGILFYFFGKNIKILQNIKTEDDKGIDYFVIKDKKTINIDVKYRRIDYPGDVALEDWSNIELNKVGWTRDKTKRTEFVLWLWNDKALIVSFIPLRDTFIEHWEQWQMHYKCAQQCTNNLYHSSCIFCPVIVLEQFMDCKIINFGKINE